MTKHTHGRFRTVGASTHHQSSPWSEMPRPLHIAKRAVQGSNQIPSPTRDFSSENDNSDTSMDSPPDTFGRHRSLTIPKRRGDRGGWAGRHAAGYSSRRTNTAEHADDIAPTPLAGDLTSMSRPSTSGASPPVQISAQLCRSSTHGQQHDARFEPSTDPLRYGFLYDASVEILPTRMSSVVEVLGYGASTKATLHLGSQLLLVANISLYPAANSLSHSHIRQISDDLIEDLELQLGTAIQRTEQRGDASSNTVSAAAPSSRSSKTPGQSAANVHLFNDNHHANQASQTERRRKHGASKDHPRNGNLAKKVSSESQDEQEYIGFPGLALHERASLNPAAHGAYCHVDGKPKERKRSPSAD
ncbi:hypothetical protein VTI74DRAFT_6031 [Chaetomium olivicolor]